MQGSAISAAIHIAAVSGLYIAVAMLIPSAIDLYYSNPDWQVFAVSAFFVGGVCLAIALATRNEPPPFSKRLGFLVVNILWLWLSICGAVPFYLSSLELNLASSFFESVSAITTTGSTIMSNISDAPPGILIWRSLLQWMGGIGILALGLFILPALRIGGFAFFKLESSETNDKPFSRFIIFARALMAVYIVLTVACALCYGIAGMPAFDAINHAMTTISTAGFSTHDASLGHFDSLAVLWVGIVFMIIGGLPFSILILLVARGRLDALKDPQIYFFLSCVLLLGVGVGVYLRLGLEMEFAEALTHAFFNMISILTTTGYSSQDYTAWGPAVVVLVFFVSFMGGCAGSTTGGMKSYRFIVIGNTIRAGLYRLVYPHAINTVRYGARAVDQEFQHTVFLFTGAFFALWIVGAIALSTFGYDFITAMSGSATAIANVGPGIGPIIGPAGNFAPLQDGAKVILSILMLLGRLEVLTVLVILTPIFWRD